MGELWPPEWRKTVPGDRNVCFTSNSLAYRRSVKAAAANASRRTTMDPIIRLNRCDGRSSSPGLPSLDVTACRRVVYIESSCSIGFPCSLGVVQYQTRWSGERSNLYPMNPHTVLA